MVPNQKVESLFQVTFYRIFRHTVDPVVNDHPVVQKIVVNDRWS